MDQPMPASIASMTCKTAMAYAGINNRDTYKESRKWLKAMGFELLPGQRPTATHAEIMRLMTEFCACGSGREFSRSRFVRHFQERTLSTILTNLRIQYGSEWLSSLYSE